MFVANHPLAVAHLDAGLFGAAPHRVTAAAVSGVQRQQVDYRVTDRADKLLS